MSALQLLPVGSVERPFLEKLCAGLAADFQSPCEILPARLDVEFAFHPERQQYHSTEILARMHELFLSADHAPDNKLLGVTSVDLYIPILTFVFGEAQMDDGCALVSTYRLRQEFYGLPADDAVLQQRLLKEAVHELGHIFALSHCEDYACVMAPSHAVEWIDLKGSSYCTACQARLLATRGCR